MPRRIRPPRGRPSARWPSPCAGLQRARARARTGRRAGALFGIVQGGIVPALRARAVEETCALDFDGYAIGGLAVGEPEAELYDIAELGGRALCPPTVRATSWAWASPEDLVEAVARGVDMFDCVMPTRNARNGQAFTPDGPLNIENARFRHDPAPLDPACPCEACRGFSRAYLRHLFAARELLGYRLLSLHNLTFYLGLMRQMREAVAKGDFAAFRSRFLERYGAAAGGVEAGNGAD